MLKNSDLSTKGCWWNGFCCVQSYCVDSSCCAVQKSVWSHGSGLHQNSALRKMRWNNEAHLSTSFQNGQHLQVLCGHVFFERYWFVAGGTLPSSWVWWRFVLNIPPLHFHHSPLNAIGAIILSGFNPYTIRTLRHGNHVGTGFPWMLKKS